MSNLPVAGADPQDPRRLRELGAYARPAVVAGLADLRREHERLGRSVSNRPV